MKFALRTDFQYPPHLRSGFAVEPRSVSRKFGMTERDILHVFGQETEFEYFEAEDWETAKEIVRGGRFGEYVQGKVLMEDFRGSPTPKRFKMVHFKKVWD